jgi:autotransporter-associated beta strand protein
MLKQLPATTRSTTSAPRPVVRVCLKQFVFVVISMGLVGQASADTLLMWDVTGATGTSGSVAATAAVIGVAGSALSAGAGTGAGNLSGGTTSPANSWNRTYPVTNGTTVVSGTTFPYTDAAGSMAANLFVTWATTVSENYTLTVTNFTGLTLVKTSSAGPTSAELYYSTNGTEFTKVGGTFSPISTTLTSPATAFTPASPIVINGAAGGTTVTWRLVPFNGLIGRMGIGNAGTDNFSILGTVTGGAAKNLVWPGGIGEWTGANAWLDGSTPTTFAANDNVTINGGTITASSAVSSGSVAVGGSSATTLTGSGVTGTTLTKSGNGTLTLAMANTFSGGASASGGTLTVGANGALGAAALALNGATLSVLDSAVTSVANAISLGTNDASISVGAGAAVAFTNTISAAGTTSGAGVAKGDPSTFNILNKTGAGTATFSGNVGTQMSYTTGTGAGVTTSGGIQLNISNSSVVSHKRLELFFAVFGRFDRAAVEPGLICSKV